MTDERLVPMHVRVDVPRVKLNPTVANIALTKGDTLPPFLAPTFVMAGVLLASKLLALYKSSS